jgi:hypothetical protein
MNTMEWLKEWLEGSVAAYAAIVATAALALEIRRWFESGVRLRLSVMTDSIMVGGSLPRSKDKYIGLSVNNIGEAATTVTHMVLYKYKGWWQRLRRRPDITAIVASPTAHSGQAFPFFLESGKYFHGLALQSDEVCEWMSEGWLYVGIIGTHSSDPILAKVRRPRVPKSEIK